MKFILNLGTNISGTPIYLQTTYAQIMNSGCARRYATRKAAAEALELARKQNGAAYLDARIIEVKS